MAAMVSDEAGLAPPYRRRRADPPWWHEMVLYENHLPSFRDGNGDGIGDLEGLIQSLGYLAGTLGVTAVWVGPFFRSPLLDQGFDITDHQDVDPVFGDMATVDRLIEQAHACGLKIIADYVPNHTSDQHPWFLESRSSRDNPKRDWYVWADAAPGAAYPNNWISEVGGPCWELDRRTGQFYLHSHLPQQPDLNWRNPAVRAAMLGVLRFWLDRGVDGFRIDVAHMLMKDPLLRDNPPNPRPAGNPYELQSPAFFSQLHVNDRLHPDLHGVLRSINRVLASYPGDRVAIGEVEALDWPRWAEFYGPDLDELHLPFAFKLIETPWRADDVAAAIRALEAALPVGAWPILALGNHDRRRLASRIGPAQARVAAMLLLTLRGVASLLYGDELGMVDQAVPRERQRDHFGLAGGVSHDSTRTPMPWTGERNGGFSAAAGEDLWLPVAHGYPAINVVAQRADPGSSLNLYRQLLALRRSSPALRRGSYGEHPAADGRCLVYARTAADDRKLIALNFTGTPCQVTLPEPGVAVLSTVRGKLRERFHGGVLRLGADEGLIIDRV
jgi:alpha-glucosidase